MNNTLKSKLLIVAGMMALVAVGDCLNSANSTAAPDLDGPMFTGHPSTSWHTMAPIEKGWVGGMVIASAAGPFGDPNSVELLEMKAARTPDGELVVACGRLQNGKERGVFSVTYDPATITTTGQAIYRLQDNVMNGKRGVETGKMSVSQVGADLINADCAYVGLL
ncbi:hypothetical protein [Aeromonas phage phiWae15]|nr:hypothetical protein [Aeromonas phage phiWae15]